MFVFYKTKWKKKMVPKAKKFPKAKKLPKDAIICMRCDIYDE